MNINRTNYENYFLLYVDGELSTLEMQAVDRFTAENTDLQLELQILLDTKLLPENTGHFVDKHLLYRSSEHTINEFNYEEQFLLFIDEELSNEGKEQTIQFVAAHPELNKSLELLKQTILPVENIIFPNKELLFRKADRKPIVIGWRSLAVAAAMIGMIFFVWNLIPNTEINTSVVKINPIQPSPNKPAALNNAAIENSTSVKDLALANKPQINSNPRTVIVNKNHYNELKNTENLISEKESIAMMQAPKRLTDLESNAEIMPKNNTESFSNTSNGLLSNADQSNQITNVANNSAAENDQPVFRQSVLKELDTDDENKSLYVAGLELNKDKLRGFFRKASSIFKNKGKDEEDKYESVVNPRTLK